MKRLIASAIAFVVRFVASVVLTVVVSEVVLRLRRWVDEGEPRHVFVFGPGPIATAPRHLDFGHCGCGTIEQHMRVTSGAGA